MGEEAFSYGGLGERWWTEAGETLGASPELVRFAASRHQGASAAAAARLAGITGTAVSIRQAGYRMLRTTTVSNLLSLAAAEDSGIAGGIGATEIDAKLAKMIRSPDAGISIRAIEAHGKREAAQLARGLEQRPQELDEVATDLLEMQPDERGAVLVWILLGYRKQPPGDRAMFAEPLLGDLAPHVAGAFPDLWRRFVSDGETERTQQ